MTLIQPSPRGAGFARFVTDCCKSHKFKISAFVIAFPLGAGIARFLTDCCKSHKFKISAFDIAFPLGGRWTKRSLGRMRGATCFLFKIFQTNRLLPLPCFPLRGKCLRKQTIEVNFNFFLSAAHYKSGATFSKSLRFYFLLIFRRKSLFCGCLTATRSVALV